MRGPLRYSSNSTPSAGTTHNVVIQYHGSSDTAAVYSSAVQQWFDYMVKSAPACLQRHSHDIIDIPYRRPLSFEKDGRIKGGHADDGV